LIDPELEELKTQFIISEEEAEILEIRKILDKIYENKTVLLKHPREFRRYALVVDLTKYPLIWCDTCKEHVTYEARGSERWIYIRCNTCNEILLDLRGNHL